MRFQYEEDRRLRMAAKPKWDGSMEKLWETRSRLREEEMLKRHELGLPVYNYNKQWGVGYDRLEHDLEDPAECYRVLQHAIDYLSDEGVFDSVDYAEIPVALENLYAIACGKSVEGWQFERPPDWMVRKRLKEKYGKDWEIYWAQMQGADLKTYWNEMRKDGR